MILPPSTSEKILRYLEEFQVATVSDLSKYLGSTKANIRYHLIHLVEIGSVNKIQKTEGGRSRGRPIHFYRLTRLSPADHISELSIALLRYLFMENPPDQTELALNKIAQYLVPEPHNNLPPGLLLNQAILAMNQMGYQARWEASASGPRILCDCCPYARLIQKIPEICRLDRQIIERSVNHPIEQIEKINPGSVARTACVFVFT